MKMRTHKRARVRVMTCRRWRAIKHPLFGRTRAQIFVDLSSSPDRAVITYLRRAEDAADLALAGVCQRVCDGVLTGELGVLCIDAIHGGSEC